MRLLVSLGDTVIWGGSCKGSLLPHAIARHNLSMVLGRYEAHVQELLDELCADCLVAYDVGAHVGFFSLLLAGHLPDGSEVHAFEPSGHEARMMRQLIGSNDIENIVHVHPYAVCDELGTLTFYRGNGSFTGILEREAKPRVRECQTAVEVEGITLDEFVYGRHHRAPDLINVDVESAEASVMGGARRLLPEGRPKILVELHGPNACRDTLEEITRDDYILQRVGRTRREEISQPDQMRGLFSKKTWTHTMFSRYLAESHFL